MFAYTRITFGSSKSALLGDLKNDLAYTSNLSSCDLLSIYICALALLKRDDEDGERRIERKVSVEAESLRE